MGIVTFIIRSLPPEAEDPPPTRRDLLHQEREALIRQIRPRVRSLHQDRIRRRIAAITTAIMQEERGHGC